ncbi:MAG: alpha/beta hydrolase family protein [Promethearchaeota archaeon]
MMFENRRMLETGNGFKLHAVHYTIHASQVSKNLIILCHGFTGDKFEHGRFSKAALSLVNAGYDALLFDFTGSGENTRIPVSLSRQVADLECIHAWALEHGYESLGTIGLSFGGLTALLAKLPARKAAVFWAPAFNMKDLVGKMKLLMGRFIARRFQKKLKRDAEGGPLLLGPRFFDDLLKVNPAHELKNLVIPTRIIQGLEDNVVPTSSSREAMNIIPSTTIHDIKEIAGAGHDFRSPYTEEFIEYSLEWFKKYIP